MKGFDIQDELYEMIGRRTMACTLILENGYEVTGTHCIDMIDLINEDNWKRKAFDVAYSRYMDMRNALDRQQLFQFIPMRGENLVQR